jgi:NADH-quinone oxidoreductase subunit H
MKLGWKVLIPVAVGWLLMVATVRALNTAYDFDTRQVLLYGGIAAGVLIALTFLWDLAAARKEQPEPEVIPEWDPMAGGHPVPPLPGQQLPVLTAAGASTIAPTGAPTEEDER